MRTRRNGTHAYTDAFEAFWGAYGRKGAKATAFTEWRRAVARASPDVIMAALPAYLASKPDPGWRKDAERWLKGDCWESTPVANGSAINGHRPYQNPADQSAYDDPI